MKITAIFTVVTAVALLSLMGCGSGGGTVGTSGASRTGIVTRANENTFTQDAKILAIRESTDGWISADVAAQTDSDLTKIRAFSPAVADIHALPAEDPDSVIVEVPKNASWIRRWSAGTVSTGIGSIDTLSTSYQANGVSTVSTFSDYIVFKLTFINPLATRFVATAYKNADATIRNTYVNSTVGDGDNITRAMSGTNRVYLLSKGWGDCPAGCTQHHNWQFTLTPDDLITVSESGNPLP